MSFTANTSSAVAADGYPKAQGCFAGSTGNYYCSAFVTNMAGSSNQTFTINSSNIRTYSASGDGAAGGSSEWNTLVANLATSGNKALVHGYTTSDGGSTPVYDRIEYTGVNVEIDYRIPLLQYNWIWYLNKNAVQPDTQYPPGQTNTAITGVHRNTVLRLRMLLLNFDNGSTLAASEESFKLQYAPMAGADCIGGDETWVDVGASTSPTAFWRGYVNAGVADGTTITANLLSAEAKESYEDNNPSVNNPAELTYTESGEWDWVVQNYLAAFNTVYCFQMVAASGANNISLADSQDPQYVPQITTGADYLNLKGKIYLRGAP